MTKPIFTIIIFLGIGLGVNAQITPVPPRNHNRHASDTLISEGVPLEQAELIEMEANRFNPRKAGLYSAVLPGLGQAYNKKYWKIPIIYGGFIGLGYGINFYNNAYNESRTDLFEILDSGESLSSNLGLNEDQLRARIEKSRRERDFYIVLTAVLYFLNVADAHIDAHLKEFDLNEKLKLTVEPTLSQPDYAKMQAGLSLTLKFR